MAFAIDTYTGNGSTTNYSVTFPYIEQAHVIVTVDGVTKSLTTDYTFTNASTITFNSAPANSAVIKFTRSSNRATRLVDYQDGSTLTEATLDQDGNQSFFMAQEGIDITENNISLSTTTDQWDANSKRITNVANPTSDQDAATKHYLENTWLSATDKTTLTNVNNNIANINAVNSNSSNINSAVSNATNINTVATNIGSVNTVATDITKVIAVANDLAETVSEIETVADDLNESTSEIDVVSNNITNVNAVGNISADVTTVAGISSAVSAVNSNSSNINAVNANSSNINTVAGDSTEINAVAGISSDVTAVAGISSAVSAVNSNSSNINAVNSNSTNINTVANNSTNINTVAGANANISSVASNIASVNNFAEQYRISSSAPTTSLNVGDLYFDTTANELKVYKSSGWAAAGSTVNGTAQRFTYNITGTPTTVSGADANGNTLAYDAGFADIYVNGVRMSSADITITSGTSVVFASALANGDVVDVVAYGTFNVASIDAANIDSGTLNNARLTGSGAITINGSSVALGGNITVGETKPTISSISPSTITNAQTSITITGTNFVSVPQVEALNQSTGIWYTADTISFTNATTLVATFTLSVDAQYKLRIENPDGNAVLSSSNILTVSDAPTWSTSAGSLGTFQGNFSGTLATISASSDSTVAYSETTSVLTGAGVTLNTSTGALTTTDFGASSTTPTTYNFTIRATDGEGQTTDRSFSITSNFGATGGGQFN